QPRLLLLDEPTTGLDPAGMRDMRDLVRRLADEGITILLSSHLLYEVEELCNRVAIIRKGRIVYQGALRDLLATAASGYRLRALEPERARAVVPDQPGIADSHLRRRAPPPERRPQRRTARPLHSRHRARDPVRRPLLHVDLGAASDHRPRRRRHRRLRDSQRHPEDDPHAVP